MQKIHMIRQFHIRQIIDAVASRIRIVFYIRNKKVYNEYVMSKKYNYLKHRFRKLIERGVTITEERKTNKTIWVCWLQGMDYAPELIKVCSKSIARSSKNSGYDVVYLSEENISDYIMLPSYIQDKWKKGKISPAHYTDIIRTELLCKYGGGWIDSTVLCTSEKLPEYITNPRLFVYQDINWGNYDTSSSVISNWLIFSESNNPIILLQRELLREYWSKYDYPVHYFFYHMLFSMATERYPDEWDKVPLYSNEPPRIMSSQLSKPFDWFLWNGLISMSDIHKLNRRKTTRKDEYTVLDYILDDYCKSL